MAAFGLWVLGIAAWHAIHSTLPHALTIGAVGFTALAANAATFGLLWAYRGGDATCARLGFAPVTMCSATSPFSSPRSASSAPAQAGRISSLPRSWPALPCKADRSCSGSRSPSCEVQRASSA